MPEIDGQFSKSLSYFLEIVIKISIQYLKISVRDDTRSARIGILNRLKIAEYFRFKVASLIVGKLNYIARVRITICSCARSYENIKRGISVHSNDQSHRISNFNQSVRSRRIRSFANLSKQINFSERYRIVILLIE